MTFSVTKSLALGRSFANCSKIYSCGSMTSLNLLVLPWWTLKIFMEHCLLYMPTFEQQNIVLAINIMDRVLNFRLCPFYITPFYLHSCFTAIVLNSFDMSATSSSNHCFLLSFCLGREKPPLFPPSYLVHCIFEKSIVTLILLLLSLLLFCVILWLFLFFTLFLLCFV